MEGTILSTIRAGNAYLTFKKVIYKSQFFICQSTMERLAAKTKSMFHLYDVTEAMGSFATPNHYQKHYQ